MFNELLEERRTTKQNAGVALYDTTTTGNKDSWSVWSNSRVCCEAEDTRCCCTNQPVLLNYQTFSKSTDFLSCRYCFGSDNNSALVSQPSHFVYTGSPEIGMLISPPVQTLCMRLFKGFHHLSAVPSKRAGPVENAPKASACWINRAVL